CRGPVSTDSARHRHYKPPGHQAYLTGAAKAAWAAGYGAHLSQNGIHLQHRQTRSRFARQLTGYPVGYPAMVLVLTLASDKRLHCLQTTRRPDVCRYRYPMSVAINYCCYRSEDPAPKVVTL